MVNKCAVPHCKSGYASADNENPIAKFRFPQKNDDLKNKWIQFVNRIEWTASTHSVICELHFEGNLINRGEKCNLKWDINPVPTIYPAALAETLSVLPSVPPPVRKPPKKRVYQPDELDAFRQKDKISSLNDISQSDVLRGYEKKAGEGYVLFYNIVFDENTNFPNILESIKIDLDLHVQLQYNGNPLPLPRWFTHGHNAKLTKLSMLENFPSYMRESVSDSHYSFIDELNQRKLYQPRGRPPYSAELIRFALHLRYTSLQAYKLLLKQFPMPSISLLNKIQQGGVNAMKALKLLRERGKILIQLFVYILLLRIVNRLQRAILKSSDSGLFCAKNSANAISSENT